MTKLPPPTSKKLSVKLLANARRRGYPWGGKKYMPERASDDLPRLYAILPEQDMRGGFLAMYAGARTPATIFKNGHMHCGKAECEWIWPEGWEKLRDLGLIEYHIEDVKCWDGSIMQQVHFNTTERGNELREEFWKK